MFVVNLLSCQKESAKVQKNTIISSVLADISEFIFCFSVSVARKYRPRKLKRRFVFFKRRFATTKRRFILLKRRFVFFLF